MSILGGHAVDRLDSNLLVVAFSAFALQLDLAMVKSVDLAILDVLEVFESHDDIAVYDMDALVAVADESNRYRLRPVSGREGRSPLQGSYVGNIFSRRTLP